MTEPIDMLNEALNDAEDVLCATNLGVTAVIPLVDDASLVFTKAGSEWGLFVRFATDEFNSIRLCSAGKRFRVVAAGQLDAMLAAMRAAKVAQDDGTLAAIEQAKDFVRRFDQMSERKAS
jgi:hypothetical protein